MNQRVVIEAPENHTCAVTYPPGVAAEYYATSNIGECQEAAVAMRKSLYEGLSEGAEGFSTDACILSLALLCKMIGMDIQNTEGNENKYNPDIFTEIVALISPVSGVELTPKEKGVIITP